MPQSNGDLVRRFFEVIWNQRRPDLIGEFLTPHSVLHSDEGDVTGPDAFLAQQYQPFTAAFPDLNVTVHLVLEQDDKVIVRWTAIGTHSGDGLGFEPTGKQVEFRGITWIHADGDKFGEGWQSSNIEAVIRRLMPKD